MFKYPSIRQFRDTVRSIEFDNVKEPVEFVRTTKIHGANCSVVFSLKDESISKQSRNQVISSEDDFMGFSKFVDKNIHVFKEMFQDYLCLSREPRPEGTTHIIFYGEWCGKGIQKSVAVNKLEKMFVIFDVGFVIDTASVDESGDTEVELDNEFFSNSSLLTGNEQIYSIYNFKPATVSLDFTSPEELQSKLLADVQLVEEKCPVASHFGVEGVGEGYVYTSVCGRYKFKMKGSKHKVSEKSIRTPEELQALEDVTNFVGSVVLEPRLAQGIDYLNELGIPVESKSTGAYIKWVVQDVLKEEGDLISSLGLNKTNVTKEVSRVAREYFQGTV